MAYITWFDVSSSAPPAGVWTWTTLSPVLAGDFLFARPNDGLVDRSFYFVCTTPGTTGALEPDWIAGEPGPIADGSAAWTRVPVWQPATTYGDAVYAVAPSDNADTVFDALIQTLIIDGVTAVSGDFEPPWNNGEDHWDDFEGDGSPLPEDPDDNADGSTGVGDANSLHYVYQVWENPAIDMDAAPIGTLTQARQRRTRDPFGNCGEGGLEINRNSDEAEWLVQDRIVTVHLDSTSNDPVFGFVLDKNSEKVLSTDEQAGQMVRWTGRGLLSLLERCILYDESYLPNAADLNAFPDEGNGKWHWTDRPPGAILVRQLEEARYRGTEFGGGRQDSAIPNVYWTFHRHVDSIDAPWTDSAGDLFEAPVGDNLFHDLLAKLIQMGLLIRATPVINADGHLRVRLDAWQDHPGVDTGITFEEGVDLVAAADKEVDAPVGYTDVLVEGGIKTNGGHNYRKRDDDAFRSAVGRREGFHPFHATKTSRLLDKVGDRVIVQGKRKHFGPATIEVRRVEGKVPYADYMPGDVVTVNAPGRYDNVEDNLSEILLVEDDEAGWFHTGIQFADDDPVGVVAFAIDPCACVDIEPGGET